MTAQAFLKSLDTLQGFIASSPNPALYARSNEALRHCKECVEEEFELDIAGDRRGKKRTARELSLMKQLRYYKSKARKFEEDQIALKRRGNEISKHVLVSVGLSDPSINARQLRGILAADDGCPISHTYIGKVRDAFAETLKGMAKERLKKVVESLPGRTSESSAGETFFLLQIHDEASMRFRSFDRVTVPAFGHDAQGAVFSRGRISCIQNNAVRLYVGSAEAELPWFVELQPLARKDGPTLATAVKRVTDEVLDCCRSALAATNHKSMRCLHILVGDGVGTNENVAKRLWRHYQEAHPPGALIDYRLVVLKCASHQSNLAVLVAIAGRLVKDAAENDELCACLSRMYKYILPSYLAEFTAALRSSVLESFQLHHDMDSEETAAHQRNTERLVALYGDRVLPPEVTMVRNRDIAKMEHVAPLGAEAGPIMKRMFEVLERQALIVEEKPIVTRFFLFAPCAFALLRMQLLGLPGTLLSAGKLAPAAENAKRIKAVKDGVFGKRAVAAPRGGKGRRLVCFGGLPPISMVGLHKGKGSSETPSWRAHRPFFSDFPPGILQ